MKAELIGNKIVCMHNEVVIDELFDEAFYKFSNAQATSFINDSIGVNEVYDNLAQYSWAIDRWVKENKPDRIYISKANEDILYYAKDVCDQNHIRALGYHFWNPVVSRIKFDVAVLGSALYFAYLQCKIPYRPGIQKSEKFAVVRTKASIKKFKKFNEIQQEIENLFDKNSIYRLFPKWERIKWVIKAYRNAYREFNKIVSFYEPKMGSHFRYSLMCFYKKRIVYAELYRCLLDHYFSHFECCEFYTGNNLDRYSDRKSVV